MLFAVEEVPMSDDIDEEVAGEGEDVIVVDLDVVAVVVVAVAVVAVAVVAVVVEQ